MTTEEVIKLLAIVEQKDPKFYGPPTMDPKDVAEIVKYWKKHPDQLRKKAADKQREIAASQETAKFLVEVQATIFKKVRDLLFKWKEDVDSILGIAPLPPDNSARGNFFIALVGNLVWAATAILEPELIPLLVEGRALLLVKAGMSFGGASVGSGMFATNQNPADGRDFVRQGIADQFDQWDQDLPPVLSAKLAKTMVDSTPDLKAKLQSADADVYVEKVVWEEMFEVPYDVYRDKAIGNLALKNVTTALVDYNKQWNDWSDKAKEWARKQFLSGEQAAIQQYYGKKLSGPAAIVGPDQQVMYLGSSQNYLDYSKVVPFKPDVGRALGFYEYRKR